MNYFFLEFWVEKGRGLTSSKSVRSLYPQIFGELGRTKVPKKFQKFGISKTCPKGSKIHTIVYFTIFNFRSIPVDESGSQRGVLENHNI